MNKEDYIVQKDYRYSQIPEEETEDIRIQYYGPENLGANAIHVRFGYETDVLTDVWFIWDGQVNEGIFKCVYNR